MNPTKRYCPALFAYGTLQVPDIIHAVCGNTPAGEIAILRDFAIFRIRNEVYPGMVAQIGCTVNGLLYANITQKQYDYLDQFEGDLYTRQIVWVEKMDRNMVEAYAYIVTEHHRDFLSTEAWTLANFRRNHLQQFTQKCGFIAPDVDCRNWPQ